VFVDDEDAPLRVMRGHTGLVVKLIGFEFTGFVRSISAVVTTAGVFAAQFDVAHGSLGTSTVQPENVQLETMNGGESRLHIDE